LLVVSRGGGGGGGDCCGVGRRYCVVVEMRCAVVLLSCRLGVGVRCSLFAVRCRATQS